MPEIGPHLLGRKPSPPDRRDYKLETFLSANPLDTALAAMLKSSESKTTKVWAQEATKAIEALQPKPVPPAPPAPEMNIVWNDPELTLDQGDTGHCVGFGWAQWGNTMPIDDHFTIDDGNKIYYECKALEGDPTSEDGAYVRSGAKVMKNRGRLAVYAFASSQSAIREWIRTKGPLVIGTDWTQDMFTPSSDGYVKPNGAVAGGHCYLMVGDLVDEGAWLFLNSWGGGWGQNGFFKMHYSDFSVLFSFQGEACASVELA